MMQRKPLRALSGRRQMVANVVRSAPASAALVGAVVTFAGVSSASAHTAGPNSPATNSSRASAPSASTLAGLRLYVDPSSNAMAQARKWQGSRKREAEIMRVIAEQPMANWFNGWQKDVKRAADALLDAAQKSGSVATLVAYNIPQRDCGSYSAGGSNNADAYKKWIRNFADGIGRRRAIVILEPDALAGMSCLSPSDRQRRTDLIADAVDVLKSRTQAVVYIDGGHSSWIGASEMAQRLKSANIARADGFALNVSNFQTTASSTSYGNKVSAMVGGKHYVIDTSRNGSGTNNNEWCNPKGRSLGQAPTINTGSALVDAYLWIKRPGESDGSCNGGPRSGQWWPEYALDLAERSPVQLFAALN